MEKSNSGPDVPTSDSDVAASSEAAATPKSGAETPKRKARKNTKGKKGAPPESGVAPPDAEAATSKTQVETSTSEPSEDPKAEKDTRARRMGAYATLAELERFLSGGSATIADIARGIETGRTSLTGRLDGFKALHGFDALEPDESGKSRLHPVARELALRALPLLAAWTAVQKFEVGRSDTLRVGGVNALYHYFLPKLLQESAPRPYSIECFEVYPSEARISRVVSGELDVAFGFAWVGVAHPAEEETALSVHRFEPQYEIEAVALKEMAPDFAVLDLIEGETEYVERKFNDVAAATGLYPLIIVRDDKDDLLKAGLPNTPRIVCESMGAAKELILRGAGVGLLWNFPDALEGLSDKISVRRFATPVIKKCQIVMYWRKDMCEMRQKFEDDRREQFEENLRKDPEQNSQPVFHSDPLNGFLGELGIARDNRVGKSS